MFKIKNQIVGGSKVFIIAEIGINHNGNLNLCKKLISAAKKSGADAVKLQIIDPDSSYNKNTPSYKIFKKNILSFKQLVEIKNFAKIKKIILFATPGDFKSLEIIKKLKFPAIKISSGLITNEALLIEAAKTNLPIILSTGMAYLSEIKKASQILKKYKNKKYSILKCTSLYPSPASKVNLNSIITLGELFNVPIGFSDHTKNNDACIASVSLGAKIIEKHFTLDKRLKVPDQKISADPNQFSKLVKSIRNIEKLLGNKDIFPSKEEIKKRKINHRTIISIKKIKKDEIFTIKNIALKRSLNSNSGLHPRYFFKIIGKKNKHPIRKDTKISKKNLIF